jgi:hypothetical protein
MSIAGKFRVSLGDEELFQEFSLFLESQLISLFRTIELSFLDAIQPLLAYLSKIRTEDLIFLRETILKIVDHVQFGS